MLTGFVESLGTGRLPEEAVLYTTAVGRHPGWPPLSFDRGPAEGGPVDGLLFTVTTPGTRQSPTRLRPLGRSVWHLSTCAFLVQQTVILYLWPQATCGHAGS